MRPETGSPTTYLAPGRSLTAAAAAALLGACGLDTDLADELGPEPAPLRIVDVSAPGAGASPTAAIDVLASAPLEPAPPDDAVVVVAGEVGEPCDGTVPCERGACLAGRCQWRALDDPFLADLDHPPLSASRAARAAPGTVARHDPDCLRFSPLRPLAPRRLHTVAVSAALRGADGRTLAEGAVFDFVTGDPEDGAPLLELVAPAPGARDLPRNLARVLVRFSEAVQGVAGLRLDGPAPVAATVHTAEAWCAGCLAIEPRGPLPPGRIAIADGGRVRDDDGLGLFGPAPAFFVGEAADTSPPAIGQVEVSAADRCLVARWLTDEPAAARAGAAFSGRFATRHEVGGPAAPGAHALLIEAYDLAGNRSAYGPLAVQVPDLAPLAIHEVLADPAGAEPGQEWIELVNHGDAPLDLAGFALADGGGQDVLPAAIVTPGAAALIVGAAYDPLAPEDAPPAPDALLVRLASGLGTGGLRNAGEPLALLDPDGQVVSSYHARLDPAPGQSVARIAPRACDVAASWTIRETPTPGRP